MTLLLEMNDCHLLYVYVISLNSTCLKVQKATHSTHTSAKSLHRSSLMAVEESEVE